MGEVIRDRLHIGRDHEIAVCERLRACGWIVQDWGQGLLDDRIRQIIRHGSREPVVLWRWIPDLIAVKDERIVLVDPKGDLRGDTDYFSIEVSAWQAHLLMLPLGLHIAYVWSDFSCNVAHRLKPVKFMPGVAERRTSFYLVRKSDQRPWEWAFGTSE